MAVQVSYPGVYIEEFAPGAPIQGVGTSTAAFIGAAEKGELNIPTKLTSWAQFVTSFGDQPIPGFFLWYAVRGFFENDGQVCYVVRASNGDYAGLGLEEPPLTALEDRVGNQMLQVRARQPGVPLPDIEVAVAEKHLLVKAHTKLFRPTGELAAPPTGRELRLKADGSVVASTVAGRFRPGDVITIATQNEQPLIVRVSGDTIRIDRDLTGTYAAGDTVRLADAPAGTRTIRIKSDGGLIAPGILGPGTVLTIEQGGTTGSQVVESVQGEHLVGGEITYRVTFRHELNIQLNLAIPASVQSEEFDITVSQGAATVYSNLSIDPAHPNYFLRIINDDPAGLVYLEMVEPPPPVSLPLNLPNTIGATALAGGGAEDLTALGEVEYLRALETLGEIDDVNLIAIPDGASLPAQQTLSLQADLIVHCQQFADRFGVLDSPPGLPLFGAGSIEIHRHGVESTRGYAALYYPWLRVRPAAGGAPILVPPSGHVCGIIARSDNSRGVHKAPANEIVNGAFGVERTMSDIDQGQLNLQGINVIRVFNTGGRPVLWGARTTATDRNWQYVNIRRLFLFLEESIEEGIRWAVFEPNNLQLWQKLKRTITEFLTRVWRDGALFGEKPEDAFYVRIDESLNPFSEQALGRLHMEIGVRPAYPAEFIIIRIGIWQGGSEVSET